jgi:hypothetical protein
MSMLGSPKTSQFVAGAAEVRVSLLTAAGRQTSAHSVGVIDKWGFKVNNEFVDLKSGFPRTLLDKMLIESTAEVSFTTREGTIRNWGVLTGGAVVDYPTAGGDLVATVDTSSGPITAATTSLVLTTDVTFLAGQTVSIYSTTDPTKVTISTVESYTSGTKTLVLTTGLGTLVEFAHDESVKVSKCQTFGAGLNGSVNYFSVQLLYIDRPTSRPKVVDFWKCSIAAGITVENDGASFASNDWTCGVLVPTGADYAASGALYHQRVAIPSNPLFRIAGPLDIL